MQLDGLDGRAQPLDLNRGGGTLGGFFRNGFHSYFYRIDSITIHYKISPNDLRRRTVWGNGIFSSVIIYSETLLGGFFNRVRNFFIAPHAAG